jgi:hypothetical protein
MNVLVLCPSRGRPEKAAELRDSFVATRAREDSRLLFVVDNDDPTGPAYEDLGLDVIYVDPVPGGGMTAALNGGVKTVLALEIPELIGFVGDDHRFRTIGWDDTFLAHLRSVGGGMAYGADLFWQQGEIPTQIFMSGAIVNALGWMALPTAKHLYLDNTWKDLGEAADCLYWFPNVVIEHMHPAIGKAEWDDSYRANNSESRYSEDREAYETWRGSPQFEKDVDAVRRHSGVPAA